MFCVILWSPQVSHGGIFSTDGTMCNKVKASMAAPCNTHLISYIFTLVPRLVSSQLNGGRAKEVLDPTCYCRPFNRHHLQVSGDIIPHANRAWGTSPGLRQKYLTAQLCLCVFTHLSAILLQSSTPVTLLFTAAG